MLADRVPARGRFITLEGGEGAGKSTQARLLGDRLSEAGIPVVVTREPGGTLAGERIRALLLAPAEQPIAPRTEALLMTAARAEHVARVIEPALAAGSWVICDRFVDSTYAYQGGGRGLPLRQLQKAQELAVDGLTPDLTLLLDLPVELGLQRRMGAAEAPNRLDAEARAFHESVRTGYHSLVAADRVRWHVIDAAASVDQIADAIWQVVIRRFGAWLPVTQDQLVSGTGT
jgi:dTMP kinase